MYKRLVLAGAIVFAFVIASALGIGQDASAFQSPIPTPTAMIGDPYGPPLTILPTPTNAPTWTPTPDNRSDDPFPVPISPIETPTATATWEVVTPVPVVWPTATPVPAVICWRLSSGWELCWNGN